MRYINLRLTYLLPSLLTYLLSRKLNLFGYICRMDDHRLVKTMMFGETSGQPRRGRPHREWLDDITDCCG